MKEFFKELTNELILSDEEVHKLKLRVCKKYHVHSIPRNSEIIEYLRNEELDLEKKLVQKLKTKRTRTLSGVGVVAVMCSPSSCPHGKCIYCPGGVEYGSAQSYTGKEPASLRALRNEYDPYKQTDARIKQLNAIGHSTEKLDLIIMGGTFLAREKEYKEWFVKNCYDAMNGFTSKNLEEAKKMNESATSRCVGLTIETRPDWCRENEIDEMLRFGATKVELGVQTIHNDVLEKIGRKHTIEDTIYATQLSKDAGLKVCYHIMLGLPNLSEKDELSCFKAILSDSSFMPDMLKIYPTLVIKGTKLYDMWMKGEYEPLTTEKAVNILAEVKKNIPPWVRIQRIERDIPSQLIDAGIKESNLRQLVQRKLREEGNKCNCIRCREVGFNSSDGEIKLIKRKYDSSGGKEFFLSFENARAVIGYARLREPSDNAHRVEIRNKKVAIIREMRVFGEVVPIGKRDENAYQHKGYGKRLLEECERIAFEELDAKELLVLSGVGAKNYYRKFGYIDDEVYIRKRLNE